MKEAYVTFETAQLLKEKGFDWFTYAYYTKDDVDEKPYFDIENLCPDNWNGQVDEVNDLWFSAPTQQMACRWLREEHKIHITTEPLEMFKEERIVYEPTIYLLNDFDDFALEYETVHLKECDTNEDAVEAALEYTFKNLI